MSYLSRAKQLKAKMTFSAIRWCMLLCFSLSTTVAFATNDPVPNPDLPTNLGCASLDVVLILDESGSIDDGPNGSSNEQSVRDAAISLANGLKNSGASLAVITFSTSAQIVNLPSFGAGYNEVDDSYVTQFTSYLNTNYNAGGWTNWEKALDRALELSSAKIPDLVVIVTDGNPTAYVSNGGCHWSCDDSSGGNCTDCWESTSLDRAMDEANALRSQGSHMFGLAVGTGIDLSNIAAITGPDQDLGPGDQPGPDPAFHQADYAAIPFSDLVPCLTAIATESCDPCEAPISLIDFEDDADSNPLAAGDNPSNAWASLGITISSDNPAHPPMIFDTSNPTGGDNDLGTPNQDFGGPGVGSGGSSGSPGVNNVPLGNVLILSEDGDSSDPDDNESGGTLTFSFSTPLDLSGVQILDVESSETGGIITAYDASNSVIATASIGGFGNNSVQTVLISADQVSQLDVHFAGSGAVAELLLCTDTPNLGSIAGTIQANSPCDPSGVPSGLGGVTVQLLDENDAVLFETTTDPMGNYHFENLPAGYYTVLVAGNYPVGAAITEDPDSDADLDSGELSVSLGQHLIDIDWTFETETCSASAPADTSVECGTSTEPAVTGMPTLSCSGSTVSADWSFSDVEAGSCPLIITRTFTAEVNGCDYEVVQVITVIDTQAPVFSNLPGHDVVECDASLPTDLPTASDACSTATITFEDQEHDYCLTDCGQYRTQTPGGWGAPANGNNPGVYRDANFDAAFPSGLQIGCTNTLQLTSASAVEDFLPSGGTPSMLPPGTMVDPTSYGNTLAGHLVAVKLSIGFDAYDPNFAPANGYLGNLILNSGPYTGFTVTEIVALADQAIGGCVMSEDLSALTAALTLINENFVDGVQNNGNLDCPEVPDACHGYVLRVFTATDECGNSSVATQCLAIIDTTPPVAPDAPATLSIECAGEIPAAIALTAIDNCDGDITVDPTDEIFPGDCPNDFTVVRTWTFVDACGNTSSVSQSILVDDDTAPVAPEAPADLNLDCAGDVPAAVSLTAVDNCDGDITVAPSEVMVPGACANDFTLTRTWTFVDVCGNTSSVSQTIVVNDEQAPVAPAAPADLNLDCAGDVPAAVSLTAVDNCDGDITVAPSEVMVPGACANDFTLTRTWTFVDVCGNTSSVSQTIVVLDDIAPELSEGPADLELTCDEALPEPAVLTATDNCGTALVTFTENVVDDSCPVIIERVWTATDDCGNTDSYTQTITVYDVQLPVIGAFEIQISVACDAVDDLTIPATDNCSELIITHEDVVLSGGCYGTLERTWIVTDLCGNQVTALQYIALLDEQGPTLEGVPADMSLDCGEAVPAVPSVSAFDNCSAEITLTWEETLVPGNCPDQDNVIWTWTATDYCGNVTTASTTILFDEGLPPVSSYCFADFTGDGQINTEDMLMLIGEYGCEFANCGCDLNGDGRTDTQDMLDLLGVFGTSCE